MYICEYKCIVIFNLETMFWFLGMSHFYGSTCYKTKTHFIWLKIGWTILIKFFSATETLYSQSSRWLLIGWCGVSTLNFHHPRTIIAFANRICFHLTSLLYLMMLGQYIFKPLHRYWAWNFLHTKQEF